MKSYFSLSVLFLLCILLYGCPLNTDYPLDDKQHPIDSSICGKWRSEKQEDYMECVIAKKNKTTYKITTKQISKAGYQVTFYNAYYTQLNHKPWLVLFSVDTNDHKFMPVKLDFSNSKNTMLVSWINEKLSPEGTNPKELREWIEKHYNDDGFFDAINYANISHRIQ